MSNINYLRPSYQTIFLQVKYLLGKNWTIPIEERSKPPTAKETPQNWASLEEILNWDP